MTDAETQRPIRRLAGPLLALAVLSVMAIAAEFVLRWRYAEPQRQATSEVAAIQRYLQLDRQVGFTWRPDITPSDDVRLRVRDVAFEPLSTDALGFKNTPKAIARVAAGELPAVIGLGDSFMEHAHAIFYDRFRDAGVFYVNRAIHRQTCAQYNVHLERALKSARPRIVLYGLFENDFAEAEDHMRWQHSGLDWFTYHSGTWCGPPVETSLPKRVAKRHLGGFIGALSAVSNRVRGDRMTVTGPSDAQVARVADAVRHAHALASEHDAIMILVLIPSRATALAGTTSEAAAYDTVLARLGGDVSTVIDLRSRVRDHPDPGSLYYVADAHWNANGMNLAADAILEAVLPLLPAGLPPHES